MIRMDAGLVDGHATDHFASLIQFDEHQGNKVGSHLWIMNYLQHGGMIACARGQLECMVRVPLPNGIEARVFMLGGLKERPQGPTISSTSRKKAANAPCFLWMVISITLNVFSATCSPIRTPPISRGPACRSASDNREVVSCENNKCILYFF